MRSIRDSNGGPCWIVECPKYHPGEYFALCACGCGRHYWTKDVHEAARFPTKECAERARGGDIYCIAVEHIFGLKLPHQSSSVDVAELVEELRSTAGWAECYGKKRSLDLMREAADALEAQGETIARLTSALEEIARMRTELSGHFSIGSRQSDIARKALGAVVEP